jgi:hypothetical protein
MLNLTLSFLPAKLGLLALAFHLAQNYELNYLGLLENQLELEPMIAAQ